MELGQRHELLMILGAGTGWQLDARKEEGGDEGSGRFNTLESGSVALALAMRANFRFVPPANAL
jgi:hypothetical protein